MLRVDEGGDWVPISLVNYIANQALFVKCNLCSFRAGIARFNYAAMLVALERKGLGFGHMPEAIASKQLLSWSAAARQAPAAAEPSLMRPPLTRISPSDRQLDRGSRLSSFFTLFLSSPRSEDFTTYASASQVSKFPR